MPRMARAGAGAGSGSSPQALRAAGLAAPGLWENGPAEAPLGPRTLLGVGEGPGGAGASTSVEEQLSNLRVALLEL